METLKKFFDKLQSKPLYLNHTRIKSIQVCIDPAGLPNIRVVHKLNDHDHMCEITFSKETMKAVTEKSGEIRRCLMQENEKLFLVNNEMKVFSERMHNNCAVSFVSIRGVRINMMDNTFSKMMNSSAKLSLMNNRLQHKVNETAKNLKQLLDILLAQYTQCNVNNPDFKNFLQQLHQSASSLVGQGSPVINASNQNLNTSDTSNDNDDEDDEDEGDEYDNEFWPTFRRRRGYHHYDDYDEDNEFDEVMEDY